LRAELAALELHRLSWSRVKKAAAAVAGEFTKYDLLTYSSAISFQVLYAVVPLAMLALAFLGIVGAQSVYTDHLAPTLRSHLSHDAFAIVDRTARKAMSHERLWWGSLGLLVTVWGMGASLRAMMTPLNGIYGAREQRSWPRRLAVSIVAGFIVMVCVYGALAAVLAGRLVHTATALAVPLVVGRWLVALMLLLTAIVVLLRFVPAKQRPIEWVTVGSTLSAVSWIVATVGFGAYISAVSYSSFYGALATLILLLIYLHVSAIAFLLGVTVDALLREKVRKETTDRRRRGRPRTPAGR
jgi:membrane protein